MNRKDYNRLSKIIQRERANILEKQDGLLDEDSIDKAVLNNLSIKLSINDLSKVTSIISHYYDDRKGKIAHNERMGIKTKIFKTIKKYRKKQKKGKKK